MAVIEFRNVGYRADPDVARSIISDLNFTVERGERLVLLGQSGCGKTTTLRLINRLLTPVTVLKRADCFPTSLLRVTSRRCRSSKVGRRNAYDIASRNC